MKWDESTCHFLKLLRSNDSTIQIYIQAQNGFCSFQPSHIKVGMTKVTLIEILLEAFAPYWLIIEYLMHNNINFWIKS